MKTATLPGRKKGMMPVAMAITALACTTAGGWASYASVTMKGRLPALDEAIRAVPLWSHATVDEQQAIVAALREHAIEAIRALQSIEHANAIDAVERIKERLAWHR